MTRELPRSARLAQAETIAASETPPLAVELNDLEPPERASELRYTQGHLLGQGGMGEVRSARDTRLGREVAVKVLHRGPGGSFWHGRRRFLREARVQGQLEHPSVVPVYDLELLPEGEARLYMKRVLGLTLESVIAALAAGAPGVKARFPRRRLLTAFVSLCRGIDYAHARGVVHRDIKPGNIMLGDFGEVHILDWGIARLQSAPDSERSRADEGRGTEGGESPAAAASAETIAAPLDTGKGDHAAATAQGTLLGTPGYMAPEQVRGDVAKMGAATDVFALGAVLFEVLTLSPLVPEAPTLERLKATLTMTEGRAPSSAAPDADIPPELDAICLRACALRPEDRFPSAGALAEAVDTFLDGDRDLAVRRALAESHVEAAESALRGESSSSAASGEARAAAVRSLARALALDPRHVGASERLGRLLMETSGPLPREAAAELEEARNKTSFTLGRAGLARIFAVFGFGAITALMGVRMPILGATVVAGLISSVLFNYLWLRRRAGFVREVLHFASALTIGVALTGLSYVFGPTTLVSVVAMINGALLLGQTDFRKQGLLVAICTVPLLVPFAIGALGLGSWPYEITNDHIVIPAKLVSFPPAMTMVVLAFISMMQVLGPLVIFATLRERLRAVEERLFLHSWHLRQLARGSAPSA